MNRWDVLVAASNERWWSSAEHLTDLMKQTRGHDVNVITLMDDAKIPLHEKRNILMSISTAEFISFVDDDDRVPSDFVSTILDSLDTVIDYVGFEVRHYHKGVITKPVYHSLEHQEWYSDEEGYYRNISHLNPIRREIAIQFPFTVPFGEDKDWAERVYASGLVKTQRYIDREMYYYYSDPDKSIATREKGRTK